jgi:predicted DNA-binding transcriptional regulator AlpA
VSPARKKKAKKKKANRKKSTRRGRHYTLTEISSLADISMPTLQKYKKAYANIIPSEGEGRRQRYPRAAIEVFKDLKQQNLAKRGRGRRRAKVKLSKATSPARSQDGLLSLQKVQKMTGISYPTLLRYVKLHLPKLPHVGSGRARRYLPHAVPVFQELRRQSPRGRRAAPKAAGSAGSSGGSSSLDRRLAGLERAQAGLEREIRELVRVLKKPYTLTLKR